MGPVLEKMNARTRGQRSAVSNEVLSRPEVKAKLSAATTAQFADPESRKRQSELIAVLHRDPLVSARFMRGLETANRNRAEKTHCKHGHEFTPENTKVDVKGWRYCRTCHRTVVRRRSEAFRRSLGRH